MDRRLTFFVLLATLIAGIAIFGYLGRDTWSGVTPASPWFLPVLVAAAIVDSVNPCAISVLLLTIAFLVSMGKARRSILAIGLTYIAGIFGIYILIGLGIVQALAVFGVSHLVATIGAAILVGVGVLNAVNDLWPSFPIRLKIPQGAHATMARLMQKASLQTAFVLGAFVGLSEFPCTGGPYVFILSLLGGEGTELAGLGYLVFYNLIFVSPLLVILALASDATVLGRFEEWKKRHTGDLRFWGGMAMIALGGLILLSFLA